MSAQGQPGISGPQTAPAGGTIEISGAGNEPYVETSTGDGKTIKWPVGPGGKATVPVPVAPGGTPFVVTVGRGLRLEVLIIEIVETE